MKDKWNNTGFIKTATGSVLSFPEVLWGVQRFSKGLKLTRIIRRVHTGTIGRLTRVSGVLQSFPEFFHSIENLLRMSGTIQGLYRNSRKTYWSVSLSTCLLLHMTQQL